MNGIIAKKLGMSQVFSENGECVAVTVLEAGSCIVVNHRTLEKDGYSAIQIGYGDVKESRLNKPKIGHFVKAGVTLKRSLKEIACENLEEWPVGKEINVDIFEDIKKVTVSGIAKGHGFQGTIKRHNFAMGPKTHGSHNVRAPGSIGACSYPGRVFPGKKMPGHQGAKKATVKNLDIVKVDSERNLLYVKGAVPGHRNSIIMVKKG